MYLSFLLLTESKSEYIPNESKYDNTGSDDEISKSDAVD